MKEKNSLPDIKKDWPGFHAVCVFLIVCMYMICPVIPEHWAQFYYSYGLMFILAVSGIYFYVCRLRGTVEVRLLIYYAAWVLITRILNTDYYLENEYQLVISRIICAVVMPGCIFLKAEDRSKLLDAISIAVGGFMLVTCLLGLYAYFTGSYFSVGPEAQVFGIDYPDYFNHLVLWQTNRTIFGVWIYIAWCLMIYEFFRHKSLIWRVPVVIAFIVFCLSIAAAFNRTVKLVSAINLAMVAMMIILERFDASRLSRRVPALILAAVIMIPVVYKGYDLVIDGMGKAAQIAGFSENRPSDEFIAYRNEGEAFGDPRKLDDPISGTVSRAQIYGSFLHTIKQDPMRILIGKYSFKAMDIPHRYMEYPFAHMHNFLLQTFMVTGLVGFSLAAVFTVLLVRRMILLFFSKAPYWVKCLTLPLTGMLIHNMFDMYLFNFSADSRSFGTDIREICFFVLAGAVISYSEEYISGKKAQKP